MNMVANRYALIHLFFLAERYAQCGWTVLCWARRERAIEELAADAGVDLADRELHIDKDTRTFRARLPLPIPYLRRSIGLAIIRFALFRIGMTFQFRSRIP